MYYDIYIYIIDIVLNILHMILHVIASLSVISHVRPSSQELGLDFTGHAECNVEFRVHQMMQCSQRASQKPKQL
jgi:preprotein translocase subunit SecF